MEGQRERETGTGTETETEVRRRVRACVRAMCAGTLSFPCPISLPWPFPHPWKRPALFPAPLLTLRSLSHYLPRSSPFSPPSPLP